MDVVALLQSAHQVGVGALAVSLRDLLHGRKVGVNECTRPHVDGCGITNARGDRTADCAEKRPCVSSPLIMWRKAVLGIGVPVSHETDRADTSLSPLQPRREGETILVPPLHGGNVNRRSSWHAYRNGPSQQATINFAAELDDLAVVLAELAQAGV